LLVIPAKAGIQFFRAFFRALAEHRLWNEMLDPGFRRDDGFPDPFS